VGEWIGYIVMDWSIAFLTALHLSSPTSLIAESPYVTRGPSGRCASNHNTNPGLPGDLVNEKSKKCSDFSAQSHQ
jgi:hypothetical protein